MPAQFWVSTLNPYYTADGATLTNTTTVTDVNPTPNLVLPANYLLPGSKLKMSAFGVYQTNATTPNLTLGFYYGGVGGVALATTAVTAVTNTATVNWPWRIELDVDIRTVGATGTAMAQGWWDLATSLTAVSHLPVPVVALTTVTIDTTAAKAITLGATWGTAAAGNQLICKGFTVKALN